MKESRDKASHAIREVAAQWAVKMNAAGVAEADSRAFMEWLQRSPQHVAEYLQAETLLQALEGAVREDRTDVDALLRDVRSNVVELRGEEEPEALAPSPVAASAGVRARRAPWFLATAAALVVAVSGAAFLGIERLAGENTYLTGTGEQRRIVLDDGSTVDLNTRSRLKVSFTPELRRIELTEGEAYFTVAKDHARPFLVTSGPAVVRAVGTQFNVYRQSSRTVVTVVEGKVAVTESEPASSGSGSVSLTPAPLRIDTSGVAKPVELVAGQEVSVGSRSEAQLVSMEPVVTSTRAVATWRQRRLVFENQPLAEVVAEFNRYNRSQFVIESEELGAEPISGVFDADKPEDLVSFLTNQGDVRVMPGDDHELRIVQIDGI